MNKKLLYLSAGMAVIIGNVRSIAAIMGTGNAVNSGIASLSASALEIVPYDRSKDTTVGTAGKEHDYSISRPILDKGKTEETLNDITEKIRGSWDYATMYAAMLSVDNLGGLGIKKVTSKAKEIAKRGDDAFRYRVASAWLDVVATGKVRVFTANGGSFYSERYYDGVIKGANRSGSAMTDISTCRTH